MEKHESFQSAYRKILTDVYHEGKDVKIGYEMVREITPYDFAITNPCDRLLNLRCRSKIYPYIFGELLWYLSGSDSTEFISKYASFWRSLSDDDVHANSAYGKYIFKPMPIKGHGVKYDSYDETLRQESQWEFCKKLLKKEPNTRQAIIHIKPVQMYASLDTVCTLYLQFMLRDNKLDLHVGMRSNDVLFGTTYDVFMFTFLQELMASELGVQVGTYYHHANNIHIYHRDLPIVERMLKELEKDKKTYKLPAINKNFRTKELNALLIIEEQLSKLSDLGKDLLAISLKGECFYD